MSAALAVGQKAKLAKKGLRLSEGLTFAEWTAIGRKLGEMAESTAWAIGDWVFYGQWEYGKRYEEALAVTGLDYQTLRNYASVAGRFDLSRRRDKLSLQHHATVAALPPKEQDRWLDLAEREKLSLHDLRDRIRGVPNKTNGGASAASLPAEATREGSAELAHLTLTVEAERAQAWEAAAQRQGRRVSEWAVAVLDQAAS